jgi:hypothetical protein
MPFTREDTIQGAKLGETLTFYPNGKLTIPVESGKEKEIKIGNFISTNAKGEAIPYNGTPSGIACYDFSENCTVFATEFLNDRVNLGLMGAFVVKNKSGENMVRTKGFDIDGTGEVIVGDKGIVLEVYDAETVAVYFDGTKGLI